jgi:hypothetical protein
MKPWQKAAAWYAKHLPDRNFGDDMAETIRHGFLYSHDTLFVMAKEVCYDGQQIVSGEPNAWFVHMAASSGGRHPILAVMQIAPHPLEWCLWMRRNDGRIRAYKWQDLITNIQGE